MSTRPFSAATSKLAYAQAFGNAGHRRHARVRRGWLRRLHTR